MAIVKHWINKGVACTYFATVQVYSPPISGTQAYPGKGVVESDAKLKESYRSTQMLRT